MLYSRTTYCQNYFVIYSKYAYNHMRKSVQIITVMTLMLIGSIVSLNFAYIKDHTTEFRFGGSLQQNIVPTQDKIDVLIGFNGKPDESIINSNGGTIHANFHPFINVISASIPESAVFGISHNPNVSFVEDDLIATTLDVAEYTNSWGVDHINADLVYPTQKGTGISVAVIDTGIDYTHSDLNLNYAGGIDFVNGDSDPFDDQGHGTHVSGTLAAIANNGGVIGVAPEAKIYAVKVLNSAGSGSYSNIIAGIKWASDNKMNIASLSLGGGASTALCDAVTSATNNGVLVIAAAGNSGTTTGQEDTVKYPAACANAIAVSSTDQNDLRASSSSTGVKVELAAPGVSINSSVPTGTCTLCSSTGYKLLSGTSMATPHVSGVAALVFAANPSLTNKDVQNILDSTAIDIGAASRDTWYGYGLINPVDAIAKATNTPLNTAPSAITDLAATPGNNLITLVWSAPNNGGSAITGYKIERESPVGAGFSIIVTNTGSTLTTYSDTGLTDNTQYNYRVSAINAIGTGTASASANTTTLIIQTIPSPVTGFTATAISTSQINLSWSAPNNGGSAITDYLIQYKLSTDASYTTFADNVSGSTGGTVTGLANGLSYDFIVSAVNGIGTGPASNVATATTFSAIPISAPSVSISNPASGSSFLQGNAVTFSAIATDAEDGDISANINWESNIDGAIGTGTLISSSILSVGTHTITASITDSGGLKSSQNITVTVNSVSSISSVDKIQYSTTGGKQKNVNLLVSVHLTDGTKNISSAAIQIQLSLNGAKYYTASGTTDSTGGVIFTIKNAPTGTYHTDILSVTSVTWDGITPQNSFVK
jgi:subtilisin family serine protease